MVYGMHIIDRDKSSLKRKCTRQDDENDNDDDPDNEAVARFNDLCDELGVTPHTHPGLHDGLHHFYRHNIEVSFVIRHRIVFFLASIY